MTVSTADKPARNPANTGRSGRRGVSIPGFGNVDGRSKEAWAFRDLVEEIASDCGGLDQMSRAQLEHARRAAGLGVMAANVEAELVQGGEADIDKLVTLANAQLRILSRLGIERKARNATPSLNEYLDQKAGASK